MDTEIFYCADCNGNGLNSEVRLNKHGRCEQCDGDNVASLARVAGAVDPLAPASEENSTWKAGSEILGDFVINWRKLSE
jgi:hypothetical protein